MEKDNLIENVEDFKKGVPKKDGSGKGMRLNKGRAGCKVTKELGQGKKFSW